MSASSKIKVIAKNMTKVALVAEEASKYLAKAYNLTKDEVTFGLPLSDVRGTRLSTLCQIKVDFPCQPGKYRAYNGYCNNVQNPNWGKKVFFMKLSSYRYLLAHIGYSVLSSFQHIRLLAPTRLFHLKQFYSINMFIQEVRVASNS